MISLSSFLSGSGGLPHVQHAMLLVNSKLLAICGYVGMWVCSPHSTDEVLYNIAYIMIVLVHKTVSYIWEEMVGVQ